MLPKIDESWYVRPEGFGERVSAGGVVARIEQGNILVALVEEKDVPGYVIPKGGQDPGETIEETALREIEEESGLTEVEKIADLAVLERQSEKKVLWSINHYALYVTEQVSGTIKDTEHHMGMAWFPVDALPEMFWPDERRMIEQNRKRIYDLVIARQNPRARKRMFM